MAGVEVDNLFHLPGVEPRLCDSVETLWDPGGFRLAIQIDDWVSPLEEFLFLIKPVKSVHYGSQE